MGDCDEYKNATFLSKVVFVLVILGFLFHMIGFYTMGWQVLEYKTDQAPQILSVQENYGLWRFCRSTRFMTLCEGFKNPASWFEATQAFETLGFLAAIGALVLIILYIFVPQTAGKKIIFILSMLACFAAAGCILLGIIIYGSKVERNLSWSFALCCIGGIIFGVSGILLVVDMLKR